ncbi:MAG TPA: hypothetical protein VJU59_37880 [Paraburkholderia sp.]|jgi:hypothetical protein|uniref:hypothetical protein n=1 Tax=Paraburkholderia sp. TaxID=1926495 RepID=UPI002B48A018|nr:hypothetical protein [Paraburkholderia sp.]HKR45380.1 hypothetical protein [Paraburkholderia sp.]
MDGKGVTLTQSDYRVLLETLRERVTEHWDDDKPGVQLELARFLNMIERDLPREVPIQTSLIVARSLIVLGQPLYALERAERVLFDARA